MFSHLDPTLDDVSYESYSIEGMVNFDITKVVSKWENIFLALYQVGHRFLQVLSHFRGFEPHLRRYFFFEIL